MSDAHELLSRIAQLEAENVELRQRAGELPAMPRNSDGLPFSGARLAMVRMKRGLSLEELAKMLHVDRATIIGFESETIAPTTQQVGDIAMRLHWPLKFFYAENVRLVNPERISWRGSPWVWNADNLHWRKWVSDG